MDSRISRTSSTTPATSSLAPIYLTTTTTSSSRLTSSSTAMPSATVTSATIDPASRIDSREHDPRVVEMVHAPVCLGVLDYFLDYIVLTVASAMIGPPLKLALGLKTIKTASFIHSFVWATQLATPTLLVALVYIDRLKSKLSIDCEDWVCERLALGALITAEKYLRDTSVKAEQWAACANIPKADVNRIEREFLALLDFDMRVTDADLLAHHADFMRAARAHTEREARVGSSPPGGSIFARRERAVYHYKIQDRAEECRSSPPAATHLPDLLYPDSPEEEDTPPVVTPPDSNSHDLGARLPPPRDPWTKPSLPRTTNPYMAATSRAPAHSSHRPQHRDVEMEARMRWYAADSRYPPARPAKSPRFQPYSPPSRRYGSPTRPARSQQRPSQDYPWRSFRWSSGPRDDVWGPSGL